MEIGVPYRIECNRRLCIRKDLIELSQWIDTLSILNSELEQLRLIDKQLLKNSSIENNILGLRRKNTLVLATLCRYEQELNTEFEYGKREYDVSRAKEHENKRDSYIDLMENFHQLRKSIYKILSTYQRK
ncbi:hypothetical protein [Gramella sp. AN32]|uniref:Uncharacterized protein n=1 Tax=Christiangramia antarctica TaxID=2058158 RepID=A0ABW5X2J4_9FLAO|nr:hypothetical protein [Gramella sp. AN32]MCM4155722.1 hypothetical protein [Gramella sp. AN32]